MDCDLSTYRITSKKSEEVYQNGKLKPWPNSSDEDVSTRPLSLTYLVLTVDDTPLNAANEIISRLNSASGGAMRFKCSRASDVHRAS